jgi:type IV pilus assembly protein PilM
MEIIPKTLGTRPRLAVEIRAEGVVAARAEDASAMLSGVSQSTLREGAVLGGLKAGNLVDRALVVAAIREALDSVAIRGGERGRYVSIVVPDSAARVLLLDFDDLPGKTAEALPVVRFRLKKLLPFDADSAAVSYQIMSSDRGVFRVLAAAMPREVLEEYEGAVVAAGYLPGAVLPSTLASLSALDEQETSALVVNTSSGCVTTAIVNGGVLLLHRTLEMSEKGIAAIDPQASPRHDRRDYDRIEAEAAIETQVLEAAESAREIAQAVSVAAAYFEDTLAVPPQKVIAAGTLGADGLTAVLEENRFEGLRVQEMVPVDALGPGVATTRIPRGWFAGVRGALRN